MLQHHNQHTNEIFFIINCVIISSNGMPYQSVHNGVLLNHYKEFIWISSNEVDETGAYYTEEVSQKEKHQYSVLTHIYGI